jgi:hypothetical protein
MPVVAVINRAESSQSYMATTLATFPYGRFVPGLHRAAVPPTIGIRIVDCPFRQSRRVTVTCPFGHLPTGRCVYSGASCQRYGKLRRPEMGTVPSKCRIGCKACPTNAVRICHGDILPTRLGGQETKHARGVNRQRCSLRNAVTLPTSVDNLALLTFRQESLY